MRSVSAQPCRKAIADHHRHVGVEQVGNLVLVGLDLVEGAPNVGLFVGGILQLDHCQRQPVHERHQIWPARLLRPLDGELIDHQKVVAFWVGEVDELHQAAMLRVVPGEFDPHAREQQPMGLLVAFDQSGIAKAQQGLRGLLQRRGWDVRIDAGQRSKQAFA